MKIGIDVGHCETTAACARRLPGHKFEVRWLNLHGKDTVLPTQIVLTHEQMRKLVGHKRPSHDLIQSLGEIRVGPDLPDAVRRGEELFLYFKAPPSRFDEPCGGTGAARECGITHGMLMACFLSAAVDGILRYNPELEGSVPRSSLDLLIGCPASGEWTSPEAQKEYATLAWKATGVRSARIVPESRAAMFSSVEKKESCISAANGALVLDFGSSTADWTYMLLGRKMIESSWPLGASAIEREMASDAYGRSVQEHGPYAVSTTSFVRVEDHLRRNKEKHYSNPDGRWQNVICEFEEDSREEDGLMPTTTLRVDGEYMGGITGRRAFQVRPAHQDAREDAWEGHCRAFLEEAAGAIRDATYELSQDGAAARGSCPVDVIALTGGASRMGFIQDICREVFPHARVYLESNPSHTVSGGLVWVAIADSQVKRCRAEALEEIQSAPASSLRHLRSNAKDALFDTIAGIAQERADEWAKAPDGDESTLAALQAGLEAAFSAPEARSALEDAAKSTLDAWKDGLADAILQAINRQVRSLYTQDLAEGLMIPRRVWEILPDSIGLEDFDAAQALASLDLRKIVSAMTETIVRIVMWAVAAALAIPTYGISLLVAYIAQNVMKDALSTAELAKPRARDVREEAARKIRGEMEAHRDEILDGFDDRLDALFADMEQKYPAALAETLTRAFRIVTLQEFEV